MREHHCDLLHANSLTLCRFAGRHRERISIPVTGHLRDIMRLSAKAMGDLTRLDRLIAVSRATAEAYSTRVTQGEALPLFITGSIATATCLPPVLRFAENCSYLPSVALPW
ncbi:MAG: hypothetical protein R3C12_18810 [Planctomycetaceae bacterium]